MFPLLICREKHTSLTIYKLGDRMTEYQRRWRQCNSEVFALAEDSDPILEEDGSEDNVGNISGSGNTDICRSDNEHVSISDFSLASTDNSDFIDTDADMSFGINNDEDEIRHSPEDITTRATENKCTRSALNQLLNIIRRHGHRLPKYARTLLQTPNIIQSENKCGGQYAFVGVETRILRTFREKTILFI